MNSMGRKPPKYPQFAELLAQHMKGGTGRTADLRTRPWSTAEISKKLGCSDKTVGNYQRGQSRPLADQLHVLLTTVFGLIPNDSMLETQVMRDHAKALRIAAGYGDGVVAGLPSGEDPIKPAPHLAGWETSAVQSTPFDVQPVMSRTYDFYLSSTWADLDPELKTIKQFFQDAGLTVLDSKSASGQALISSCLADINLCSAYVAVLGMRYGTVAGADIGGDGVRSCTEHELDHAMASRPGKIFIFRKKDDNFAIPAAYYDPDPSRVLALRAKAGKGQRDVEFSSLETLQSALNKSRDQLLYAANRTLVSAPTQPPARVRPAKALLPLPLLEREVEVSKRVLAHYQQDGQPTRLALLLPSLDDWLGQTEDRLQRGWDPVCAQLAVLCHLIDEGLKSKRWAEVSPECRIEASSGLSDLAKLAFCMAWTEEAWRDFRQPGAPSSSYDHTHAPLMHAGYCAARGMNYDLPHDPRHPTVLDLKELPAGVGRDLDEQVVGWIEKLMVGQAQKAYGLEGIKDPIKRAKAHLSAEAAIAERLFALVQQVAKADGAPLADLNARAERFGMVPQPYTGTDGGRLRTDEANYIVLLARAYQFIKAVGEPHSK